MKKLKPGKDNKEDRMNFVKYWAEYVRTHDDEDWSKQQKILIDSQIENARSIGLTKEQVIYIKEGKKRRWLSNFSTKKLTGI